MTFDSQAVYEVFRKGGSRHYKEKIHCPMILDVMNNKNKGTVSSFCVEARISESTFYNWVHAHELFEYCYSYGQMLARDAWEKEGREVRDLVSIAGTSNHRLEYWRMTGWSRYGVGKNSRIRLHLNPLNNPSEHYSQLLKQASNGDFTAGEIKQLMEAVNVGLNAHQVFELQKEIDQLKLDLITINEMKNGQNNYTNKGIA